MKSGIRKRTHLAIAALLTFSAGQSAVPAYCYDMKDAEFQAKEAEKDADKCPSFYAYSLMLLAIEYWRIGEAKKADRIYRKSIPIAERSQYIDEGDFKAHLLMWAQLLEEGRDYHGVKKEDFNRLEKAIKRFLTETEKKSEREEKLRGYLSAVQIFTKTENWKLKDKYQKVLLAFCDKIEHDQNAEQRDVTLAAQILASLAEVEFPVGKLTAMPEKVIEIQPDSNSNTKLTKSKFAVAESYKLRSMKLIERMPVDLNFRASGHRHLVFWYTLCGEKDKAAEQVEILVRLLDSRDPKVLYPPPQPCPGMCGMG